MLTLVLCLFTGPWDMLLFKKLLVLSLSVVTSIILSAAAGYFRALFNMQSLYLLMIKHELKDEATDIVGILAKLGQQYT
jgi:hypothetical protein